MKVREYRESDLEALKRFHAESGYDFKFPDMGKDASKVIELAEVVEDANGNPMGAAIAVRTLEMFLTCNPREHRVMRLNAVGMLHQSMTPKLKQMGYSEANGYIPEHQKLWINTLCKRFGWTENLPTFTIRG
jgi:hypothetical protein